MVSRLILPALLALVLGAPAASAQQPGGLSPAGSPAAAMAISRAVAPARPVLRGPLPSRVPTSVASRNPARARQAADQAAVAQVRGDPGFLAGFFRGQPIAPSRRPPPPRIVPNFTFVNAPFIVNTFSSDVDIQIGDGSVTRQEGDEGEPARNEAAQPPVLSGGIQVNNVASTVNAAIGSGNTAVQQIVTGR
jgi:hypothetical protein